MDLTLGARGAFRLLAVLAAALTVLLCLSAATAEAAYQMPIYSITPADNSTLGLKPREGATPVTFTSLSQSYFNMIDGIEFEVSTSTALSPDMSLSDDYVVDYSFVTPADGPDGTYHAQIRNFGIETPGTYYFQFSGWNVYGQRMVSQIFTFHYDPNAGGLDLSMNRAQAVSYIKYLVKAKTKHKPSRFSASCDRSTYRSFTCYSHFNANRRRYQGKSFLEHEDQGDGQLYFSASFKGEAAKLSCLRSASRAACSRGVKWHT